MGFSIAARSKELGWVVGYPSGQRGQTVNLLAYAFTGSNPVPTTIFLAATRRLLRGRRNVRSGSRGSCGSGPRRQLAGTR